MNSILTILFGGLLTRADGWGVTNMAPVWKQWLAEFFNVFSCGALFALLMLLYTGQALPALVAGAAFITWRLPGFHGWERWLPMFWRGFWPSAIGFAPLSLTVHGHLYYALLAIPMGLLEALCYSGGYRWLPGRVPQWLVHPIVELTSGFAFTTLICGIFYAGA